MNIYFVSVGNRPFASYMTMSFKKHMSSPRLIQITDTETLKTIGADDIIRTFYHDWKEKVSYYMIKEFSNIDDAAFITVNDDCILGGDLGDALSGDYDIAIVKRTKPKIDKTGVDVTSLYPYSNGLVIVKNRQFYKDCLASISTMGKDLWAWFGDMACIRDVINKGKYRVKFLPHETYCKTPSKPSQTDDAAILWHYAGPYRKEWMRYHGKGF